MAVKKEPEDDLLKQLEEMQAKLEALEAKQRKDSISPEEEQRQKEIADRMEEYVEVKLFKDNNKYKDDVFVSVNGENCVIKRGERVKIKRKFAEVLDHSEHQDYETSKLIEAATKNKKLGDL